MTIQFVENVFVDSYYPTIENTFTKPISHQGQEYQAEIIDTAGQVKTMIDLGPSIHAVQREST